MAEENETEASTEDNILASVGETDSDETTDTETTDDITESSEPADTTVQAGPQDLTDANGNVVATGGPDRRHYESWQNEKRNSTRLQNDLNTATASLTAIEKAGNIGTQLGLNSDEVIAGAQIIAAYKKDPVGTLTHLLTQAQAAGHNIDGMSGGGSDMQAIRQMISDSVKPLVDANQVRLDTQTATEDATKMHTDFLSMHPDATVHQGTIAQLLERDNSLSLDAAYYKLKSFYLERRLDWSKDLATLERELAAKPAGAPQGETLPGTGGAAVTDVGDVASATTSFDDIIRQSMSEAGA
jgi:hypothetical protein